ncbi:SLC13 family permease [Brevibacterium sp. LE-L]|uniref:SLC13 family permease n=1 Tax=Brevibacterium sp. LE-L TaxID=3418557 RepID=UPI003CF82216
MNIADVSILVLVLLFAATMLKGFNLGLGSLAAAFGVSTLAGLESAEVIASFPGDFFIMIVGVTALFGVAQINGTLDWMLDGILRLVRNNATLVALVPFFAGALLTAFGTLPAAATAIVAPIALGLSARYGLPALMMAVLGIMGILSGLLSPLAVFGIAAKQQIGASHLLVPSHTPITLLAGSMLAGILVCVGALIYSRARNLLPKGQIGHSDEPLDSSGGGVATLARTAPRTRELVVTLGGIGLVLVLAVGFDANIGLLGATVACLQMLVLRMEPSEAVSKIPWSVILLIGGLLTYIGVMQSLGAFERISQLLTVDGSPMISLLLLCYIAGITSFAASSIAVFVTVMPLLPSVVDAGVSPIGAILAVALASVVVDINPLGITGGLILGSAEEQVRPRLFRQLLIYGLASVAVGPFIVWGIFGWW